MNIRKIKDSLPEFPRNAVQSDTEARLTSVFEMGTGEPHPYGRPRILNHGLFIKISRENDWLLKTGNYYHISNSQAF